MTAVPADGGQKVWADDDPIRARFVFHEMRHIL